MATGLRLTLGPGWIAKTWESLFGSCSTVMSTFSNTRKRTMRMMRKHENDVKCKMTNIQEGYRIEAKYYLGAAATTDSSYGPHVT